MSATTPQGQKLLQQVLNYKYFVSYLYDGGMGMIEVTTRLPMRGIDDVKVVCQEIKRTSKIKIKGQVVVINWILL